MSIVFAGLGGMLLFTALYAGTCMCSLPAAIFYVICMKPLEHLTTLNFCVMFALSVDGAHLLFYYQV